MRSLILAGLCLWFFQLPRANATTPAIAGTLSIVPGLGQVSNGDIAEGLLWFGSTVALFSSKSSEVRDVGFKIWEYNLYDAYRDAGAQDTAKNNVLSNYFSFLNPVNLFDPISVGVVGYSGMRAATASKTASLGPRNRLAGAFYYGSVGLGEEALFRGFLFPGFSHLTNSYLLGATLSSIAFAASHLGNQDAYYHSTTGLSELFALGMIFCLQTYKNHFDLRHSIFTHAWYDFIIDYAGKKADAKPFESFGVRVGVNF